MKKSEKISEINNRLSVAIAEEKTKLAKAELEYRERVAVLMAQAQIKREESIDDPDEPQDGDQPTVWLNGEQWTAAVVARRILNKLPKLNYPQESLYIEIAPSYLGGCDLSLRYVNTINGGVVTSCDIQPKQEPEVQASKIEMWLKEVDVQMAKAQEIMREEADNE